MDALGGESLTEKERRLSETIAELQKLREQMIAQRSGSSSSDYADRVSFLDLKLIKYMISFILP